MVMMMVEEEGEVPVLGSGGLLAYALLPTGTTSGTVAIGDHTHLRADITDLDAHLTATYATAAALTALETTTETQLTAIADALEGI